MFLDNLYDFEYEFYDDFYESFTEDLQFYSGIIGKKDRILELMCGTGRVIGEFKEHEIWGVDNNEHMLQIARDKFKGLKNVHIENQNVLDMHDLGTFNTIIIPLNSFMLFNREDQLRILKSSKTMLEQGGMIVIDVLNGFPYLENLVYHGDTIQKGNRIISRFFVPTIEQDYAVILYFYDIFEDQKYRRVYSKLNLRIMNLRDMQQLAEQSNLKIERLFGNYNGARFNSESERMITVLR